MELLAERPRSCHQRARKNLRRTRILSLAVAEATHSVGIITDCDAGFRLLAHAGALAKAKARLPAGFESE
jgi:hypothetical protein